MRAINVGYYGDQTRWFIGVVKNINDPKEMGRVKVRIYGVHNHDSSVIKDEDLPWAQVVAPVTQPGVPGLLSATGIQIGAQVYGIFLDGQASQQPLVIGVLAAKAQSVTGFGSDNLYTNVNTNSIVVANAAGGGTGAGANFPANIPISQGSNAEVCFNFIHTWFVGKGARYPSVAAAAFVGNFINESGQSLNQYVVGDNGNALGIAQWNGPRKRALEAFLASNGVDRGNPTQMLEGQLQFWAHELETKYNYVYAAVEAASTVERATQVVYDQYETPLVVVNMIRRVSSPPPTWGTASYNNLTQANDTGRAYHRELVERIGAARSVEEAFAR